MQCEAGAPVALSAAYLTHDVRVTLVVRIRARLYAAAVKAKVQFTRATPWWRGLRSRSTVFIHPKISSIRFRRC